MMDCSERARTNWDSLVNTFSYARGKQSSLEESETFVYNISASHSLSSDKYETVSHFKQNAFN